MQSRYTVHIAPTEWRWVMLVSSALVIVAFLPFLWVAISGSGGSQWQFMGALNNHQDAAVYIGRVTQGVEGSWLVHLQHTPELHNPAPIGIIYPILGQIARLVNMPSIAMYHAARVVASFFMYLAIYQLGAIIWMRVRTRQMFFVLATIGAGFGWLLGPLTGEVSYPDLTIPEAFPFYSSLVNVHFPLALACLALLVAMLIAAFRPGNQESPNLRNGGLGIPLLSIAIGLLYPQILLPVIGAVTLFLLIGWFSRRRFNVTELRWWLLLVLPTLPLAALYYAVVAYNPAMTEWNRQNVTISPSLLALVLGFGLPLIVALPGLYRALRRFEADGDQFMLLWLVFIVVLIYLPSDGQRRFAAGIMIPIAYFAARSLEDFWFQYLSRRWRFRVVALLLPIITISQFFVLIAPIFPMLDADPSDSEGVFLQRDYARAYDGWLRRRVDSTDVILAAPQPSLWIPAWAGARVVYGHPFETLNADQKRAQVLAWYSADAEDCGALLDEYDVRYIIYGPQEAALGPTPCIEALQQITQIGDVTIYGP